MTDVTRIGLDLAKSVFQVHGVNADEKVTIRRSLRRGQLLAWFSKLPPCLVGMEACAGAHYWARELTRLGHTVRLMPPLYVKGYVWRNKNDAADAAAICEAVSRPAMRFVPSKTPEQQAATGIHRARSLLTKQETMTMNSLRGLMAEFGIIAPQGRKGMAELLAILNDPDDRRIPEPLHSALQALAATLRSLAVQLKTVDKALAPGDARTPSRAISARSRASAWSPPPPSRRTCPIRMSLPAGATSPPRSAWCHARRAPAARCGSALSARRAAATSAASASTARCPTCARRAGARTPGW